MNEITNKAPTKEYSEIKENERGDSSTFMPPHRESLDSYEVEQRTIQSKNLHYGNLNSSGNLQNQSLNSLVDTIRSICRRDSDWYLRNRVRTGSFSSNTSRTSPWELDSSFQTPMVSSPHVMNFPDLNKRRDFQIQKHEQKLLEERKARDKKQRDIMKRRERAISLGDELEKENREMFDSMQLEDELLGSKRKQRLKSVLQRTASEGYLTHSKGFNLEEYSPTMDMIKELKEEFEKQPNPPLVSVMYGVVNAVIVLPVLMSFGNIIFHDEFFRPYLPVLVKLTVISGIVHQMCFSMFSTLPFAVGSVQDAGLIFLSTIASNIVRYCQEKGYENQVTLATTLVGLSLFTACLGTGLIVIGRLRLAQYVQKLPTPVVGGYLAFIGFFCGQSALSLLTSIQVSGILDWWILFRPRAMCLMAPGIFGGCGIYAAVRKIKHMAVLPLSIMIILMTFYGVLYFCGMSLDDAKDIGLMSKADAPPSWYHTWDYIKFDKVIWAAFPSQTFTVVSMIFVVALSSSLDIAAIDLEVPKPLAYNHELKMIGVSNLISGLSGGYTGSYIFSQSIFSLRAGIRSRLAGYVTAAIQAVTVFMPISILAVVPNFIFASLLIMICIDLMIEWLWDVRKKLSNIEYTVTLVTFGFMQVLGVEYGIVAGVAFYLIITKIQFRRHSLSSSQDNHSDEMKSMLNKNKTYGSTEEYEVGLSLEDDSVI